MIGRPPAQNYTGLIGYWTFDSADMTGGTVWDRSGQGNHGNAVNISTSTFYTRGKLGQALQFDGVNDYINVPASVGINDLSTLTVCTWLNPSASAVHDSVLVRKTDGSTLGWDFYLYTEVAGGGTGLGTLFRGGGGVDYIENRTKIVPHDTWSHVCMVQDGDGSANMKLYVNGATVGISTSGNTGTRVSDASVSLRINSNTKASMDDVRVYNRVLSTEEIRRLYNAGTSKFNTAPSNPSLDAGLTGWWTFDGVDTSSGTIMDRSGRGNHASMRNMATATAFVIGKKGQAIALDGVNDYVDTTRPLSNFITASEHTISLHAYFKGRVASDGDRQGIISDTGGIVYVERDNVFGVAESIKAPGCETSVLRDYWIHIIQVHKGGIITTHYNNPDGSRSSCSFSQGDFSPLTGNLRIGISTTDSEFEGLVDDVRVYNRGLSAAEIDQLFDQTSAKMNTSVTNALTGPGSGLVGWWTFDGPDMVGGTVMDRSGRGNHGDMENMATSSAYAIGRMGQALNFDGNNDGVYFPVSSPLLSPGTGDFTVTAWAYLKGPFESSHVYSDIGTAGSVSLSFGTLARGSCNYSDGTNNSNATGAVNGFTTGRWYHVACVKKGTMAYLYRDGELDGSTDNPSLGSVNANGVWQPVIGSYVTGANVLPGSIDDVRIYNRALSPDEIRKLYNQAK